jgi:hypothetical protein
MTDAVVRDSVDAFAAYTGIVRRLPVMTYAHFELASFRELRDAVLGRTNAAP